MTTRPDDAVLRPAHAAPRLRKRGGPVLAALVLGILAPHLAQAAPWVVITEIHYHPPEGDALEFIEILNREPPRLDLTDWRLEGEVEFVFPQEVTLLPGERVVIARDPRALRERYPGLERVLGPYAGKLDNKGGRLTLRNPAGARLCEVRYDRDGEWPAPPDGSGHTLSIRSPYFDPAAPESWASSQLVGGTPGAPNRAAPERGELLIREGDEWRYRAGRFPLTSDWNTLEYDDSDWESGPSGFGYDDGDDATVFPDMKDSYASVFVRKRLDIPDPSRLAELILVVDFDDGFVAYLNGREVARANIGQPGQPVPPGAFADGNHNAGSPVEFPLGTAGELLREGRLHTGTNLIAVQIHNNQISSSDLTLIVELESRERADGGMAAHPLLNEVLLAPPGKPAAADEFVEVYNPSPVAIDLGGYWLSDDPKSLKKVELPRTLVEPGGFAALKTGELGIRLTPADGEFLLTLARPDGRRVLDALRLEVPAAPEGERSPEGASRAPFSRGRHPDGSSDIAALSRPSPGEPNTVRASTDIVINEIMYNPITESTDDEFIELYHRGSEAIALEGYTLRGGVRFRFEGDQRMAPGAYLVIAKSPAALRAKYGLDAAVVVGPYEGQLSNRGETLTLRDGEGNVVDRVEYADRAPWPRWADGLGGSLELVHPELDSALGASWAASDDRAKAEWQTLSYTKRHRYVMGGVQQEFQMMLLAEGECFVDDISLGAPGNLIPDGEFRGGRGWLGMGTHERSRAVARGPAGDTEYYHLIADGRGNPRGNFTAIPVGGRLRSGTSYRVELRAKWQRGSPLLLTRMAGQSLAQLHRLDVPSRLGSPGERNTVYQDRPAPAVGVPEQHPITPAAIDAVSITVPISAAGSIASAALRFRHESERTWQSVPLVPERHAPGGADPGSRHHERRGARLWRAVIPPVAGGKVEFYVEAKDAAGQTGTYPPEALDERGTPVQTALYGVGITHHPRLPSYTLLVTDREWRALQSRPTLSNRMATGTLVFGAPGSERIFHGVELRPRGSPFTRRGERNWRVVFGAETLDGRRSLTIDAQPNRGLGERLTFWLIDALGAASSRHQFVYFDVFGERESGVYEDVEKIDGDFLDRWFESPEPVPGVSAPPPAARLHKVDDYWELTLHGDRQYQEAFFRFRSTDPEQYRWNFPPRVSEVSEDFGPFIELIRFLDPGETSDAEFLARAREVIAVDQWIRVLAARALSGDWDTLGGTRGKNAFVYLSPADGLWYLLPWDADLAWGRDYHRISTRKFRSVTRLLESPLHERLFNGHLEYLVLRRLDGAYFGRILEDLAGHSGKDTQRYAWFADQHRDVVLRRTGRSSQPSLRVLDARRIERAGRPDLARVRGVAPVLVRRLLLDGIEGRVELEGAEDWTAEFPIGPEGGELKLEALDIGDYLVDASNVRIEPRPGARPLAEGGRPADGRNDGESDEVSIVRAVARTGGAALEPASSGGGPGAAESGLRRQPRQRAPAERATRRATGRAVTTTRSLGERQAVRQRPRTFERTTWTPPTRRERPRPRRDAFERLGPALILGVVTALVTLQLLVIAVRRHRRGVARRKARPPLESSWRFDDLERRERRASASPPPSPPGGAASSRRTDPVAPPTVPGQPLPPPSVPAQPAAPPPAAPPTAAPGPSGRTGRDRLASPVASALRDLSSRDFDTADRALRFLWRTGKDDIAALIAALIDRRSTPIAELDLTEDDGVRVIAARGEPGVEIRDLAEILLANAIGEPPVDRPRQEDWVAHWQKVMRRS